MNGQTAAENLSIIRTLMERSALYRRALAPIMLLAGFLGMAGAAVGVWGDINSMRGFTLLWVGVATVGAVGAMAIARKQAIKDNETFWSPPMRRVLGAILPGVVLGAAVGVFSLWVDARAQGVTVIAWMAFYGCALHAAGYFTTSGLKWFSWCFILPAALPIALGPSTPGWLRAIFDTNPHVLMGVCFGGLQAAYGVYLRATEKRNRAS